MTGTVYLVGAGPGDPDLLTVRALRLLRSADVVLHDALVTDEILQLARPHAQLIDVGKRVGEKRLTQGAINQLLVECAQWANIVVRLKGGDPLIFGRVAEEMSALRAADIDFEIVPGITAAIAAAAQAKIPLTDRSVSSSVAFVTAHKAGDKYQVDFTEGSAAATTIAIYMPGGCYREISQHLIASGRPANTPCVVVASACRANQELLWTDLASLQELSPPPEAPALLIIGAVAGRGDEAVAVSLLGSHPEVFAAVR
jgi:uroporphyrin-III C-methyltransferase